MIEALNLILIVFMLVAGVAAVMVSELVSATFLLGAFSFFAAILWSLLQSADVSFTEAMVGVGASTIFFLLALFRTRHHAASPVFSYRVLPAVLLTGLLALLFLWGSVDLPLLGDAASAPNSYLSPYFLLHTLHDTATPNAVTAVVTDYRGFDTLIESAVIFTAGTACLLIMRSRHD